MALLSVAFLPLRLLAKPNDADKAVKKGILTLDFSKNASGTVFRPARQKVFCTLPDGTVRRTDIYQGVTLDMPVTAGPCDESDPALNGRFQAKLDLFCKVGDDLANPPTGDRCTGKGSWQIISPQGKKLANGDISLIVHAGTHRAPLGENCEACYQQRHIEGFINGSVLGGPRGGMTLSASLAGDATEIVEDPEGPNQQPLQLTLEGVLAGNCPN